MSRGVILLVLAATLGLVAADLPIHCIEEQVRGKWTFSKSKPGSQKQDCGYEAPDKTYLHFDAQGNLKQFNFEEDHSVSFELGDNIVLDKDGKKIGYFTMVYDEGFEVTIGQTKYFAFFHYEPLPNTDDLTSLKVDMYKTDCTRTLVGWYHDSDNSNWGCFKGSAHHDDDGSKFLESEASSGASVESSAELLETTRSSSRNKHKHLQSALQASERITSASKRSTKRLENHKAVHVRAAVEHGMRLGFRESLVQAFQENLRSLSMANLVRAHQSARSFTSLQGKTTAQLRKLLGRKTYKKSRTAHAVRAVVESEDNLPASFDWRHWDDPTTSQVENINFDTPINDQGSCGSCYAWAAIQVAEIRLRIKTRNADKTLFSVQEAVSCSRYNQGCDGGYPFLVAKQGHDFGFAPRTATSEMYVENEREEACSNVESPSESKRYFTYNYHYVGGHYGACSEYAMKKEIMENGPVTVGIYASDNFFDWDFGYGPNGINPYDETGVTTHEGDEDSRWESTNHAVVVIGWGVTDDGRKYWIVKNTWGEYFGDYGYFYVLRGHDTIGIESMAMAFEVSDKPGFDASLAKVDDAFKQIVN